jgi:hypothetical protein
VEQELTKPEPSAGLDKAIDKFTEEPDHEFVDNSVNEAGDMEESKVSKESTEAPTPEIEKTPVSNNEQQSTGDVISEERQLVEGLHSSGTLSPLLTPSDENLEDIPARPLGEFDDAPVTHERLQALPNSTAEAVKPMIHSALMESSLNAQPPVLTPNSRLANFEGSVELELEQGCKAVLEAIRSASAALDNAAPDPLSHKNLKAHTEQLAQPTRQTKPQSKSDNSIPTSSRSSSTTKIAQANNTFLGICSLADFMEELVIDEHGVTYRDDVISAFGRLSANWRDFIGSESALQTLEELQLPVTQARTKLGNISLHNFLRDIEFDEDGMTSIVNVATAFRQAAQVDARPPSPGLAKLLEMEAELEQE